MMSVVKMDDPQTSIHQLSVQISCHASQHMVLKSRTMSSEEDY